MKSLLTILSVVLTFGGGGVNAFCPFLCSCDDDLLTVECPAKSELDVIPITLNPMIKRLDLSGNRIRSIDASLQFYGQLESADFTRNEIESIPERCFSSQKRLTELRLDGNRLKTVTDASFVGLRNLKLLSLAGNGLVNITERLFLHLVTLEHLDLRGNRLSHIHSSAFATLIHLRSLDLSWNSLTSVSFSGLDSLVNLDLAGNKKLASGNLPPNLDRLNVSHCGLSSYTFGGKSSVKWLDISHNLLESLATLSSESLERLSAGGNRLQVLRSLAGFASLSVLDLSNTEGLLKVEALESATLTLLVVDGCMRLRSFEVDNSSKFGLSAKRMNWTSAPKELSNLNLSWADVSENPLLCDCEAKWLREMLLLTNDSIAECVSPNELAGSNLLELDPALLVCSKSITTTSLLKPGGDGGGDGDDTFQLLLVTVCVGLALMTGLAVLVLVHCVHCTRRSGCCCINKDMESPVEDCCSCCQLGSQGKMLRLRPPLQLQQGVLPHQHLHHHSHHTLQQQQQQQQQQLPPATYMGNGNVYQPEYAFHHHPCQLQLQQQQTKNLLRQQQQQQEQEFFGTTNTRSSFCSGTDEEENEDDDYFVAVVSTHSSSSIVRSIPVSEL